MSQEILTIYKAQVDEHVKAIQQIVEEEKHLLKQHEAAGQAGKSVADSAVKSAEKQKTVLNETGKAADTLKDKLAGVAKTVVAAFAVTEVIKFGKECVKAFQEAELNARKLQTAVSTNGGLQKDFDKLLKQSEALQKITIFSDDDIQKAQTAALQFGLNADAVSDLIPLITDFASATGQDLNSALESVLQGVNGNARALKIYGVQVNSEQTRTQRFAAIQEQLTAKFKGQAEIIANTSGGGLKKLGNAWDDLKEKIGGALAPAVQGLANLAGAAIKFTETPLPEKLEEERKNLNALVTQIINTNDNQEKRNKLIADIQRDYPDFIGNIDAEKASNEELITKLKEANQQYINKIVLEKKNLQLNEQRDKAADAVIKQDEAERSLSKTISDLTEKYKKQLTPEQIKNIESQGTLISSATRLKEIIGKLDFSDEFGKTVNKNKQDMSLLEVQASNLADAMQDVNDLTFDANSLEKERNDLAKKFNITIGETVKKKAAAILGETEAEREKRLAADKKAADEKAKNDEEAFKRQQDLNKNSANETLKRQLAELEVRKQKELQSDEFSAQEKLVIDFKYLEEKKKLFEDDGAELANIEAEQQKIITQIIEQSLKDRAQAQDDVDKQNADRRKREVDDTKKTEEEKKAIIEASLGLVQEFENLLLQTTKANSDERIAQLEKEKEARLGNFDSEQDALDEQRSKKLIGERAYEAQSAALKQKRVEEEKKLNERINAEKRKQAQITKAIAVFEAGLNFSKALIAALTIAPPASFTAEAITAAIAGVQLAAVIASPLPKFKKGGFTGRGTMIDETGDRVAGIVHEGEFVLNREATRRNRKLIEAIHDDDLNRFINQNYILPALMAQKKKHEESMQKSFAENIAGSLVFNGGLNEYGMNRSLEKGANIRNVDELGKAIAKHLNGYRYSAYH